MTEPFHDDCFWDPAVGAGRAEEVPERMEGAVLESLLSGLTRGLDFKGRHDIQNEGIADDLRADPLSIAGSQDKPVGITRQSFQYQPKRVIVSGLDSVFATMGRNFGDFDNDGYLDMYLGTDEPDIATLIPNRMFRNIEGKRFSEITAS